MVLVVIGASIRCGVCENGGLGDVWRWCYIRRGNLQCQVLVEEVSGAGDGGCSHVTRQGMLAALTSVYQ